MPGLYLHIYDTGKHILERWERESKNMRKRTEIAHKSSAYRFPVNITYRYAEHSVNYCSELSGRKIYGRVPKHILSSEHLRGERYYLGLAQQLTQA